MKQIDEHITFDEIREEAQKIVKMALEEDRVREDITAKAIFSGNEMGEFVLISKSRGVLAGSDIFRMAMKEIDAEIDVDFLAHDGASLEYRQEVARVKGRVSSILSAERTALNFLQHLSGVASKTKEATEAIEGYKIKILDTRKTIPGLRLLQKYAVVMGGGANHRMTLADMFLIKDNHISAAGSVKEAIKRARQNNPDKLLIEIEVSTIEQLKEAFDLLPDIIMLDNMDDLQIKEAKQIVGRLSKLEVSGNVGIGRLLTLARLDVDYVSMGSLTHSVTAHDFSLLMKHS